MVYEQVMNNLVGGLVSIRVMETGMNAINKTSQKNHYKKTKKSSSLFSDNFHI